MKKYLLAFVLPLLAACGMANQPTPDLIGQKSSEITAAKSVMASDYQTMNDLRAKTATDENVLRGKLKTFCELTNQKMALVSPTVQNNCDQYADKTFKQFFPTAGQ